VSETKVPIMDVRAIEALIPHRYPFLLVDRVVEFEPMKRLVAWKSVTIGEPFFAGHFPGHPVMPGVLVLEALAQAAALLAMKSVRGDYSKKVAYLTAIDAARFRRTVVPGDRLELVVEVTRQKGAVFKVKGEARVEGEMAAEAELMAMVVDRQEGN
jgi:3-hydroxyacyl-[acyl-carrier-protein] dehydratase